MQADGDPLTCVLTPQEPLGSPNYVERRPATSERSCGRPGLAPSMQDWTPSAPPPKPTLPARTVTTTAPPGTRPWPPPYALCATTTSSANRPWTTPWPAARNGNRPPPARASWPSRLTPNCAAATPARSSSPYAPLNQLAQATSSASICVRPRRKTRRDRVVDPRPSSAASRVPRRDRRAPAADGAWRRSGSGRPRQDLPWLAGIRPGCDIATAQTGNHTLGEDPSARRRA